MPNSSPVLSGLISNVLFDEQLVNGAAQLLDTDVTFTDVDSNFTGGILTVSGLLPEDAVGIRNEGTAAGQIAVTGSNIRFGNIIIGSFTGGTGGMPLVVTFNPNATPAAVDALIQNLTYANSSNTPTATRDLVITINDAAGATAIPPTSFTPITGLANPFDGVDVGAYGTPSFADLDGDGDLDAIVGESTGTLRYFRNTGTALAPVFTERTGAGNPFNGFDVGANRAPTFADLDGDGDLDAVIGESDGTLNYYRNTGTALDPVFTERTGPGNPFDGVDVGFDSAPSFADLDGDGDLDAVIGEFDGVLNYYRNTGTALDPVFTLQTGAANPFNGVDIGLSSTPSFSDLDGDGDLDALIGSDFGNLRFFRNTGTALDPVFTEQNGAANPFTGVDLGFNSAPSFADLDGDGDLDALIGESSGVFNYFRNTTPKGLAPVFSEQTGVANLFNGVDVGVKSAPAFADLDGDGDLDALIGESDGTLSYYRNTGTALAPVFTERTGAGNPFNGVDVGVNSAPTFADLDGDGDLDAIVGESFGAIRYFRNTGTALDPVFTERTGAGNPFNGFDSVIGFDSTLTFADLDSDGDLDAVIGAQSGRLNYFRNTGTALDPVFTERIGAANPFNGVDVGFNSAPAFADLDGDGDLDAVIGEEDGVLNYFRNTGTALAPIFTEQTGAKNPFNGVDVGNNSTPTFADLDGDGDLDALIGNFFGELNYYRNTGSGFVLTVNVTAQSDSPFTNGDDVVNLNTFLASGSFPQSDVTNALDGNDNVTLSNSVNVGVAFSGGLGNDTITGGTGNDVIDGGAGADSMVGGLGDDRYVVDNVGDVVVELAGEGSFDRVDSSLSYTLGDNLEILALTGTANLNGVGNVASNSLFGNSGVNQLSGGDGNDFLYGGLGADVLDGGTGLDLARYDEANYGNLVISLATPAINTGAAAGDTFISIEGILAGAGNDAVTGDALANSLYGRGGADTLNGGGGADFLYGGLGADSIDGGDGFDAVRFDDLNYGDVVFNLLTPAANTGPAAGDTIVSIESIIMGAGNDTLVNDNVSRYLYGMGGADAITGGSATDFLFGGQGADALDGGGGTDFARYDDNAWGDIVVSLANPASNTNVAAGDTFTSIEGLVLGAGNDTITGDSNNNFLYGYGGNDVINGGDGADNLFGGQGADALDGGAGVDLARYDEAGYGNLRVSLTNAASNTGAAAIGDTYVSIEGFVMGAGNDTLIGDAGVTYLYGGDGNDRLEGLAGNDQLTGGVGLDSFVFNTALNATTNVDRIFDFNTADDSIVLAQATFGGAAVIGATGTLDSAAFATGAAATTAQHRIIYDSTTGGVFFDADGVGGAAQTRFATLNASLALTNADFLIA